MIHDRVPSDENNHLQCIDTKVQSGLQYEHTNDKAKSYFRNSSKQTSVDKKPTEGRRNPEAVSVIKLRTSRSFHNDPPKTCTYVFFILLILVQIFLLAIPCVDSFSLSDDQLLRLSRERAEAAKKWAPIIHLHPEERFFPTAVHSFLKNVVPREISPSQKASEPPVIISMSRSLDTQALPEGPAGENTYLFAPIDPGCKNCPLPRFLYGDKPSKDYSPPIYATISSCLPTNKQSFRRSRHLSSLRPPPPRRRFRLRQRSDYKRRGKRSTVNQHQYHQMKRRNSQVSKRDARILDSSLETQNFDNSLHKTVKPKAETTASNIELPSSTLLPPKDRINLRYEPEIYDKDASQEYLEEGFVVPFYNETQEQKDESEEISDLETLQSESPRVTGSSNQTLYDHENVRITRTPEVVVASSSIKNQYLSYHDKEHEKKKNQLRGHKFTVTYWMFYPFSQGKEVCTSRIWFFGRVFKPRIRNKCFGEAITLNSHVGDWEHVSIYFEDNLPTLMYVSMHTYGAYYEYNRRKNIFFYRGKDTRLGIPLNPKYPRVIKMDGTHPILYSALGSHGLWAGPGVHRYENLVPLDDKTAPGTPWKSWKNIDVIDYREPDYSRPDRQWLQFYGRWGNPSNGCHRALFGTCDLASGPTGIPLKRSNFPCHLPYHPTFFPKD